LYRGCQAASALQPALQQIGEGARSVGRGEDADQPKQARAAAEQAAVLAKRA
jgi:hypothetical protein